MVAKQQIKDHSSSRFLNRFLNNVIIVHCGFIWCIYQIAFLWSICRLSLLRYKKFNYSLCIFILDFEGQLDNNGSGEN